MRYVEGANREQSTLFPETLDEYITEDNPVRVIDAFIDSLDLVSLGFNKAQTKDTGRKPYSPYDLLKLYIYGYLNQVRSTRRLERECHRNVEVLWLMKRLAPDFKTIANFRRDNSEAIVRASRAFIRFCREANLLNSRLVALDGSKFRSVSSDEKTHNRKQLKHLQKQLDRKIEKYLNALERSEKTDQQDEVHAVQKALAKLKERRDKLDALEADMEANGANQCNESEPEAKRMRSGREGFITGYNIQSVIDDESGLMVHHDVTTDSTDNRQLEPMIKATVRELAAEQLTVVADSGYSNGQQLAELANEGIDVLVPPNRAINNQGDFYQKSDFIYHASEDHYVCPAGEVLKYTTRSTAQQQRLYAREGCNDCALQSKCTKANKRWVTRHYHEDALERARERVAENPQIMRRRSAVVERPFAQIKHNMGIKRFLCWGLDGVRAEMGLISLSYNLNRLINQVGIDKLLKMV